MSIATTNLAALMSFSQLGEEAEDAQTVLDRTRPEQDETPADGTADFGTAEAIATAIVGTVLLGPVGGILLGGAQGWLKKKSEQSVLDRIASEQNVLTESVDVYQDQLNDFKSTATNENDFEQIGVMEAGLTTARKFMLSADPELRARGIQIMGGVNSEMNRYAGVQETQSIAADALDAQLRVELDDNQYSRYTALQTDFDNQSAGYLVRKQAVNTAIAALQSGTAADIHAAMILFNKALDPRSAVLGEERTAITEMGSALDSAYNFFGEKFTGQKLNAQQRRELGAAILRINDTSEEFQMRREAIFTSRAIAANLPEQYLDKFRLVENLPGAEPLDIPKDLLDRTLEADRAARDKQSMLIGDAVDATFVQTEKLMQDAADFWKATKPSFNRALSGGPRGNRPTN